MLKAVGMDYDKEPKKTKQEMELSAWNDQNQVKKQCTKSAYNA